MQNIINAYIDDILKNTFVIKNIIMRPLLPETGSWVDKPQARMKDLFIAMFIR